MNIRPKTIRRLVALLLVCVLTAAAAGAVWAYHNHTKARQLLADRDLGVAAYRAGDYALAVDRLRPYHESFPDDYDATAAYASSLRVIAGQSVASIRHLAEARQLFEQLNRQRPDDRNVAQVLLDLYTRYGSYPEAVQLADEMLARDPKDATALLDKAEALCGLGRNEEALATSEQLNAAAPDNFTGQRLTIELLHRLRRPGDEVTKRYAALLAQHPDDPRFEALMAAACEYASDEAGTLRWLRSAASRPMPDPGFVGTLAALLGDKGLHDESHALLAREADRTKDPAVVEMLVMRLWEDGRYADVVRRLEEYHVEDDPQHAPSDLLALKALAEYQSGQADAARALVAGLKARRQDNGAQAWASALSTRYDGAITDLRAAVKRYEAALLRGSDSGIIRYWMAESYLRMSEPQLAMAQWRRAAVLMPGWVLPRVAIARTLLASGRPESARQIAADAVRAAPQAVYPRVVLARARYATLGENASPQELGQLLKFVVDLRRVAPRPADEPETLPILADLQARTGDKAGATRTIVDALAGRVAMTQATTNAATQAMQRSTTQLSASTQPAPSTLPPETLLQLLAVSRRNQLDLEDQIASALPPALIDPSAHAAEVATTLSPQLALQWAGELARQRNPQDGLKYIASIRATINTSPANEAVKRGWEIVEAQYRDAIGDPGARDAWVRIGDANPDDLSIQSMIATSVSAAASDREFFARTLDRLQKLSPPDGQLWRLTKARWLLAGAGANGGLSDEELALDESAGTGTGAGAGDAPLAAANSPAQAERRREIGDAIVLLTDLVRADDRVPEYRVLLAHGLLKLGNVKDATEHLRVAVDLDPTSVPTCLQFAALLQTQGKDAEARVYLDRAARSPMLGTRGRRILASLLVRQGDVQAALDVLRPAAERLKDDEPARLMYAELLHKRGYATEAAAVYDELLKAPAPAADTILSAANFYATSGRADDAAHAIARLNDSRFPLQQRTLMLARFTDNHGSPAAARELYVKAVDADRKQAGPWLELINFYSRHNQLADAQDAAVRALAAIDQTDPARAAITRAQTQIAVTKALADPASDLRPLIETLAKNVDDAAQAEMLRAIQQDREAARSISPESNIDAQHLAEQYAMRLRQAAEQYPQYLPLQERLAQQYLSLGRVDEAARVAESCMGRRGDADAARLAFGVYASAGRWSDATRAAQKWRDRSLDAPAAADEALAEAMIHSGDGAAALKQLAPYLAAARAEPERHAATIQLAARAMIAAGKPADARAMLEPLLDRGAAWRKLWLDVASLDLSNLADATGWIDAAAQRTPADAPPAARLQLAQAWIEIGRRFNDDAATQRAREILKPLVDRPDANPAPALLLASLEADARHYPDAEQLYRRVLKDHPDQPDAQNNLAYLLMVQGTERPRLEEAKALASKAVARSPNTAAFHDTLARITAKLGLREQALASFKAALTLEPANLEALVGLANELSDGPQPDRDKAAQLLQRIDAVLNKTAKHSVPASLQQELDGVRQRVTRAQ